ncbi:hypothetical protein AB0B45_41575 [Nonomuraea sp. NPDC049152]|uniref:hypothetical protein n=1 Tax=Nonomuraea sp. NPDC049152 TaxID=3154350 RepID=UPI0033FBEA71
MSDAPRHVVELAERRAKSRAERDYATADALRREIEHAGWLVRDSGQGFELTVKPLFEVWPLVRSIPISAVTDDRGQSGGKLSPINPAAELGFSGDPAQRGDPGKSGGPAESGGFVEGGESHPESPHPEPPHTWHPHEVAEDMVHAQQIWDASLAVNRLDEAGIDLERQRVETADVRVGVGLVVDGWGEDVRRCVTALLEHTSAKILALDLGNQEDAGLVLHELAEDHHERLTVWHVAEAPHWRGGTAEWGACRTTLLRLDASDVHVLMETSTVLEGDALTPLVALIKDGAVAAGWKGVEPAAGGMEWHEAGPGQVRALLGYLMAVRRSAALGAFPEKARYYRNADLELSLALEGPLVVPEKRLPVRQERHHGYHDVPADYRDKESRRTYDRVLRMLRSS